MRLGRTLTALGELVLLLASPAAAATHRRAIDNSADAADSAAERRGAGARPWKFSALATIDLLSNASGGLKRGVRLLDKLALAASYEGQHGWSGLVSAQYTNGTPFSASLVGDTQTVSNIEAIGSIRLYEAWLAKDFGPHRLKIGLIDLNSEFDLQETAGLFLNSSDGIAAEFSHTGRSGPSIFPQPGLAVTAAIKPAEGWLINLGGFDGVPGDPAHPRAFAVKLSGNDGALLVAQVTRRFDDTLRLEAGAWAYTADFPALDRVDANGQPRRLRASRGAYALIDGHIAGGSEQGSDLHGWLRAGLADGRVDRIDRYIGGGLVLASPLPGRSDDSVGVSVMHAAFSADARRATPALKAAETTIEATWRFPLPHGFAIQPDVQYVFDPSGVPGTPDALVAGVRLTFAVSH